MVQPFPAYCLNGVLQSPRSRQARVVRSLPVYTVGGQGEGGYFSLTPLVSGQLYWRARKDSMALVLFR